MNADSLKFFRDLLSAPGVSGFEEAAAALWRNRVAPFSDSLHTDVNGSVTATLKGKSEKTSILLLGHIDQIGLIVRYIDENGFLYFAPVGGVDVDTLISQRVKVLGPRGHIPGVVGKVAIHLMDPEQRKKKVDIGDLWVDIGAKTKAEAEEYAPIGTPIMVGDEYIELLNGRFASRVDNRFGAFVISEVLRRLSEKKDRLFPTVHGAATVQEETSIGFTGAANVAYRVRPTAAIAVDVNHSMDIPGAEKKKFGDAAMGKGAILTIGVSTNKPLTRAIQKAAKDAGLTVQLEYDNGRNYTDADAMPGSRTGIAAAVIGNPLRYMHNTIEMAEMADIVAVIDVLEAFLLSIQKDVDYTPGGSAEG